MNFIKEHTGFHCGVLECKIIRMKSVFLVTEMLKETVFLLTLEVYFYF